jgi:hypothetical protein
MMPQMTGQMQQNDVNFLPHSFKVGINCVKNGMRSISNVIDEAWLDLS